uniref:PB1-like domain-containing protein n=1 Tax=Chenopodium quinoa TaxID=63459 RepID=A0A803M872_CHEQI
MRKAFGIVTLKFWHGGVFKFVGNGEMVYQGGKGATKQVDPDLLCYFDLLEMGKECGEVKVVEGLYYLIPGLSLSNGLRRIVNDSDVVELGGYADKFRTVEVYVFHGVESLELEPTELPE